MSLHNYFVLFAFTFLGVFLLVQIILLKRNISEFLGTPTIDKPYYYAGKVTIFTTWALFIIKAIIPRLGYISQPVYMSWIATGLLWFGAIVVAAAIKSLGKALKVGLPKTNTTLQTRGIYSISRNPLYSGIFIIAMASCLYFPDLINVSFTLYGIYIHHQIIKQEEVYLAQRFAKDWDIYSSRVSRYL